MITCSIKLFFAVLYLLIAADWEFKLGEQVNGLGKNKYLEELKYTVKPVLSIFLYAMGFISALKFELPFKCNSYDFIYQISKI